MIKADPKYSPNAKKEWVVYSSPGSKAENLDPNKTNNNNNNSNSIINNNSNNNNNSGINQKVVKNSDRPLKCLETLAEKAGITFDEKYDSPPTHMEKSQSPQVSAAQQATANTQQMPLQITPEHFQQLQQFQLQQAFGGGTIHVKQEYPNQQQHAQAMNAQSMSAQEQAQVQQLQQVQQMQIVDGSAPQSPHQNSQNAQNTMSLQQAVQAGQVPAEWQHGRVQVLQQPIQNSYLQQMYSPTPQLVMGNILHGGLGQQQIQLIAAGKPFQGGQITPQMLTTAQGKQVISGTPAGFSGAYALPTIPSSQSQTLLFSPVGVIPQQQAQQQNQQNIIPTMQAQGTPQKTGTLQDNQKQMSGAKVMQKSGQANANQQNAANAANQQQAGQIQVTQTMPTAQLLNPLHQSGGQTMQFATSPWGPLQTQLWTTNGLQPQTVLSTNQIIFRGTNPDGTPGMFIQQAPQQTQQTVQSPQNRKYI